MESSLKICLIPMDIKWEDKQANLKKVAELVNRVHPATDLIVLPEMFSTGFITGGDKEELRKFAEKNSGETIDFIKGLAAEKNMAIAGSYIAETGGLLFNRAFFIEPGGDETFADKKHLFTMAGEDKIFSRGDERFHVRFRGWSISMIVCYDIRFPVWCRNVGNEYDLMLAVANWPTTRVDAWNHLLKARAIENEAYVCGVNCKGTDTNGFEYDGSSAVFDFKGKDIATADPDGKLLYATLSYEKLERFREKFPAWKDADSFRLNEEI